MNIVLAQRIVSRDLSANFAQIKAQLAQAAEDAWVIFPEGMLSGYAPADAHYIASLDAKTLITAIDEIQQICNAHNCNCIFGTAFPHEGQWFNATLALIPGKPSTLYFKNNLARLDHTHFAPGCGLQTYHTQDTTFGVQMCRELLFPEQWRALKQHGAQVIFHINNAIQPHDAVWRHVLITRALENQIYVVSVNNGASPQALASCVISPQGEVLLELPIQQASTASIDLDLEQVSRYYFDQIRSDLAKMVLQST